jgi:ACS family D-galactonate transporter-like MFS transporter
MEAEWEGPHLADTDRRRWSIALLLGFGVLVNYFDRVNLSVSHDSLVSEFGISDVTFGFLLGAYNWTYAACQLPSGALLDRFGVRRVGCFSTLLWSIASFAAAITRNIEGFFAARFLLGIGEAPTFPANAKAIGKWFPRHERSFATALFDSAAKLGSAIGVPLIGFILLRIGWRLSFAATGAISFLYFLLFVAMYHDPHQIGGESQPDVTPAHRIRVSIWKLIRQRQVIGLAVGFGSYNYVFYLLVTWLPVYLSRTLHIDQAHSFAYTGVPWFVAAASDLLIGGLLVDVLIKRGWNADRVRRTVLIGGTAMGLGILGAAQAHTPGQALLWISISIGGLSAAAPVGWSVPSLIAPGDSVGSVGGIMNLSNQISGIAAPIITGFLVSGRQSFAAAFTIAAAYLLVGIAAYIFLLGEIRTITMPIEQT